MGRKNVPIELADLHGNPRQRGRAGRPPRPAAVPLKEDAAPPEYFNATQREVWNYAIEHAPPGLLKTIDAGALAAWSIAWNLHAQAVAAQNQLGRLVVKATTAADAGLVQSPFLAIINRQALIMLRAAEALGFTPTSRPRAYSSAGTGAGEEMRTVDAGAIDDAQPLQAYLDEAPPSAIH